MVEVIKKETRNTTHAYLLTSVLEMSLTVQNIFLITL